MQIRTDLAMEEREIWEERMGKRTELAGVRARHERRQGIEVDIVEILDERGEEALGKPKGRYVTLETDVLLRREEQAFERTAEELAREIRQTLETEGSVLVAGLGNANITPDAIGPDTIGYILVTQHLKESMPEQFKGFRSVTALQAGVMGTTGVESAKLIGAMRELTGASCVIAVDALASRSPERLCRTIQLTDAGIIPGSGIGNSRAALNAETMGVPVIAIGVPTVVDAGTMCMELASRAGVELDGEKLGAESRMIVTPRDVDNRVKEASRLIGYAIDLALHDGLTVDDIESLL
ncbi:MAG: GPR endopeptidase [Eubacteriales bacterium]|nr:GPR endopeptidase [Eubacteriales bacterium]